ncbi:ribosomal RNA small subunit methyltransferase I [Pseudooceanicola nanhaiensis]|uniref:Ribosomal RNA small subunit methyltransferase I n=1 Tax=Pseudooceanicola nanhaiensis TaxID=375761 RepID=A0A917WEK9_9RHOB|nr:16S rRNA (cytidine(1402)-2'-O)-methyltransferase [Pseudooceanicola nanhaiensis]GGL95999.1 ribosomal RNA small subunit methyltransferase I [Pseudooceanicola nanhaiensis]
MNPDVEKLPGGLYLVSVPIGTARDITLRALDILASAEVLAAEDTRSLRRLMEIHGIALGDRPLLAYHDHNGARVRPRILAELEAGRSVAYASEAGTPLVADPGFTLARAARDAGHGVTAAPGAVAAVVALTLSGLPSDRFLFAGFLPNASGKRKTAMQGLAAVPATLIFYESPKRVAAMLRDAAEVLGAERPAALCRELTKRFEEVRRGTLAELAAGCEADAPRGEIVVLIGEGDSSNVSLADLDTVLREALDSMSVRDAADHAVATLGAKRRDAYQRALDMDRGK